MNMNQYDIEYAARQHHECPNVRRGVKILLRLLEAVNSQSDGWAYWSAPSNASEKLQVLLQSAGNLQHGASGTITVQQLKAALTPIKSMVTRQKNKFKFDIDAVMNEW